MSQFFFVLQRFSVTDRNSAVFKPEWDLLSVLLLHWTVSILCGVCVLPLSLRIPETPVSPCCSPHLAAVVFPYSARPKSPFQGCCSLTQEVDLASACSRYLEILSLVCVRAAAMVYFLIQVCPCRFLWMIQPFPCNVWLGLTGLKCWPEDGEIPKEFIGSLVYLTLCHQLHEALLSTVCVEIPFPGPAMCMKIVRIPERTGHFVTASKTLSSGIKSAISTSTLLANPIIGGFPCQCGATSMSPHSFIWKFISFVSGGPLI